ncbi:hypothetical protein M9978_17150 [Sphingomonas sp. MG17]|uniref:DUF5983 domain-containing protein n=1 Tax=Sphingomonas tagetis TaxID=2949092 RepID=A0A9X2HL54_9SPHN|nr:hypothetical protein [Sphingomonas tagetis]MCP3732152.1 hypothetical protein [Sphingomonas tagetis]
MEFGRYVVLSTAHIRCSTAEELTRWAALAPDLQPAAVSLTPYGWFVATRTGAESAALPAELRAILAFGGTHDCDYVLLDCDGDKVAELAVFPW